MYKESRTALPLRFGGLGFEQCVLFLILLCRAGYVFFSLCFRAHGVFQGFQHALHAFHERLRVIAELVFFQRERDAQRGHAQIDVVALCGVLGGVAVVSLVDEFLRRPVGFLVFSPYGDGEEALSHSQGYV